MNCRACGHGPLEEVYDFGPMPLAGDFNSGLKAKRYPLAIEHCSVCDVLQVRETVPHEVLFNKDYCYSSSTVPALRSHFKELALAIRSLALSEGNRVLEIGCGDGVLLRELRKLGIEASGIDASENVVKMAQAEGLTAHRIAFSSSEAAFLPSFDIVTCSNVFAHNEDPNDFLEGVKKVLRPEGKLIIEVHDSEMLIERGQWDCFYHEHFFYWNIRSLGNVLRRHGFTPEDGYWKPMHGGSIRMIAHYGMKGHGLETDKLTPSWMDFGKQISRSISVLHETLTRLTVRGYLYTTPGRATTLLNAVKPAGGLHMAFDASPLRYGKKVPGTNLPIVDEADFGTIIKAHPGFVLLGAWHLKQDLLPKLEPYRQFIKGIITPLPTIEIE